METVTVERRSRVWIVTLNRPQVRNAVDGPTARRLCTVFRAFDADEDAAVAVFTGAQGQFCAGADRRRFSKKKAVTRGPGAIRAVPCVRFAPSSEAGTSAVVPTVARMLMTMSPVDTRDLVKLFAMFGSVLRSPSSRTRPLTRSPVLM